MATTLSEILFWLAVVAIAIAQGFILRSTRRGMRQGPPRGRSALEWSYALVPGIALVLILIWTWHTMHDATLRIEARVPAAGVHS
jgi:hypothetical protein